MSCDNESLQGAQQSQIMELFRHWESARKKSLAPNASGADRERYFSQMMSLEKQMLNCRAESAADIAAKVAAYTNWGDFELPEYPSGIWEDIRALLEQTDWTERKA